MLQMIISNYHIKKWLMTNKGKKKPMNGKKVWLTMILIRGEVWWIDFNHSIGGEIQKTRPTVF